jgi:hypothetical protein
MNTNIKFISRWTLIMAYLGILSLMLACAALAMASSNIEQGILQLDNGIVKVKDQNGDFVPLAGTSNFEMVGTLESMNPWTVADKTLKTNQSTQIADGLKIGELVRVRGTILEDDTWLAYSIQPAEEQTDHTIILIGKVTSIDPWIVNGIALKVTSDTVIKGEIKPDMLVRVEILLLDDGTWEVISITPLGNFPPTSGCATITATVVSVNGNEIQFLGWPTTVTLQNSSQSDSNNNDENDENNNEDNGNENENQEGNGVALSPGQTVVAVVCVSDNNQLVIVKITVLKSDEGDNNASDGGNKVLVCHKPDKKGGHTLSISSSALPAHLGHGDKLGACP